VGASDPYACALLRTRSPTGAAGTSPPDCSVANNYALEVPFHPPRQKEVK
jgi:hypothetical protein